MECQKREGVGQISGSSARPYKTDPNDRLTEIRHASSHTGSSHSHLPTYVEAPLAPCLLLLRRYDMISVPRPRPRGPPPHPQSQQHLGMFGLTTGTGTGTSTALHHPKQHNAHLPCFAALPGPRVMCGDVRPAAHPPRSLVHQPHL